MDRLIFEFEASSSFEAVKFDKGGVQITIDHPWGGDSETGFGETGECYLTREQSLRLAHWLIAAWSEEGHDNGKSTL